MSAQAVQPRSERQWVLVGPWYRWRSQGVPVQRRPRDTRPAIQKYGTSDLVNSFLKDPERSLRFTDDDRYSYLDKLPDLPRLPYDTKLCRRLSDQVLVQTMVRKLFLDSHRRYYLVVAELHCDAPGFPSVNREAVCEAGFVIRRRRPMLDVSLAREAQRRVAEIGMAGRRARDVGRIRRRVGGGAGPLLPVADARLAAADENAAAVLLSKRRDLAEWMSEAGVALALEGWVADPQNARMGAWRAVEEEPQEVLETILPLYPLIADPRLADHAGHQRTIYFGLVPTGSGDTETDGTPRFDDQEQYEVRCFVRRHDPRCPKTGAPRDCHGPLVWSRPTEPYRLAAHFDPVGTAQRPVTIQLPDIPALLAQATSRPAPLPVRTVAPAGSGMVVDATTFPPPPNSTSLESLPQVCFWSIPLITIVAMFLLTLFLPIVVFLFQLWFLLLLRFCLGPGANASAALTTELSADLSAELSLLNLTPSQLATVDVDVLPGAPSAALTAALSKNLEKQYGKDGRDALTKGVSKDCVGYSNNALLHLQQTAIDTIAASLTAGVEYESPAPPSDRWLQ